MAADFYLPDEAATVAFGRRLAQATGGRGLLTLSGNLGTGKTTLSRGLVQAFGHHGAVKSPTYTLVEPYELGQATIYHFDLYRMADPEELEFLGFRDYLAADALILMEWPERAEGMLPMPDLAVSLEINHPGRQLSIEAGTPRGREYLQRLDQA